MNVVFMTTNDDRRKLQKNVNTLKTVDAKAYEPMKLTRPMFLVNYDASLLKANYLRVGDYQRYYFIENIEILKGGIMKIECSVDVLMSYQGSIRGSFATIKRQEHIKAPYLIDTLIPIDNNRKINVKDVASPFTDITGAVYVIAVNNDGNTPTQ